MTTVDALLWPLETVLNINIWKSLIVKSYFPALCKCILIDRRRQSSILDVRSFREADCDTDHYLVVVKVRERLAVSKKEEHKLDGERYNLGKLKDLEFKKQ